jgi:two-component system chemotaxis response regulator CheB
VQTVASRRWADSPKPYDIITIAASAGGLRPVRTILSMLPADFPGAILVAQHRDGPARDYVEVLRTVTALSVREALHGEVPAAGTVYVAPGGRHLGVNEDGTLCTSRMDRIRWVRPSADFLLGSAAASYAERVIAVVVSGSGSDGTLGASAVRDQGGFVIAQNRATAEYFDMPIAAIEAGVVDVVLADHDIGYALTILTARATDGHIAAPAL